MDDRNVFRSNQAEGLQERSKIAPRRDLAPERIDDVETTSHLIGQMGNVHFVAAGTGSQNRVISSAHPCRCGIDGVASRTA